MEKNEKLVDSVAAKVSKTILVHRSGKVVKVLDKDYFDVTNNEYVESIEELKEDIKETEAEHFERMLKGEKGGELSRMVEGEVEVKAKEEVPEVKEEVPEVKVEEPAPAKEEVKAAPKAEFIPFAVRLAKASKDVKNAYNVIKSEILSYGIKSRVSQTGDTFRLHNKTYAKIVIAGKNLKIYFALNPKKYKDSPIPFSDASNMTAHKETPFVFKVTSDLAVRRALTLVKDVASVDGLVQKEVVQHNHAKDVK